MNNLIQMDIAMAWNEIEEANCSLNECDLTPEIIDAISDRLHEAMALIGDYFTQAHLDKVLEEE